MKKKQENYLGGFLGLAIGDALGAPVEFLKRGSYEPVSDFQSGGPFQLEKGMWTDDTILSLILSENLNKYKKLEPKKIMEGFYAWWKDGYMSPTGVCFDIGNTTKSALLRYQQNDQIYSGIETDPPSNGAIMRLLPINLFFQSSLNESRENAILMTKLTHGPQECIEASVILNYVLYFILEGKSKEEIFKFTHFDFPLKTKLKTLLKSDFLKKTYDEISGVGNAFDTLESALYLFYHSKNFLDGLILGVNIGDDTDTVGAVYGQLAGTYYGVESIPEKFIIQLYNKEKIINEAEELWLNKK